MSPYTTDGIGLLGTKPSQEALEECDTLLMVGTSFPYIEFLPKPGAARAVQIEPGSCPHRFALSGRSRPRWRQQPGLARAFASFEEKRRSQLPRARSDRNQGMVEIDGGAGKPPRAAHETAGGRMGTWQTTLGHRHRLIGFRHDRHLVCAPNSSQAGANVFIVGNPGYYGQRIALYDSRSDRIPRSQCIAFVGDGGFSMLMAEFATAVKY